MSENFKKCMFGGFDPEDVIAYIDRTAKENKARIATLTEQNETLTKSNQEMQVELTMLRQQFVDQENENRAAEKWQQEGQEPREEPKDDDELEDGHDEQVREQRRERYLPEVPGEHGKRRELRRKRDGQTHRDGIRQAACAQPGAEDGC